MAEQVAEVFTFPTDPSQFESDDRISFSKLDSKYIAVQDDGTEFEFDTQLRRWIPLADEDAEELIRQQQSAYGAPATGDSHSRKRKQDSNDPEDHSNNGQAPRHKNKRQRAPQPKQNTAIYVTGLPPDATADEVAEVFSRKCGVIAEEIDSGRPRIKLYTDKGGNFKGDALVVFFKPQSVDMAIMLLDDTDFRFSTSGLTSGRIRVMAADSSYKKTQYESGDREVPAGASEGGAKARQQQQQQQQQRQKQQQNSQGKQSNNKDREKVIKKTQKLAAKLADWSDDESSYMPPDTAGKGGKWDKVVILSHMFTLQELEEDPAALLEIKEDVREECSKLGEVTNVVLYDLEEEGIISVKFKTTESAQACINLMHGRNFGGQRVEAFLATGREKFEKTKKNDDRDEGERVSS